VNLQEAKEVGRLKLNLADDVMDKALEVCGQMGVIPEHRPPMMLALAILGVAKAHRADELAGELTDALALVSRAEREWTMERAVGRGRA
jgi:uncharacterized UPF0146 family protein